jgi:hypothetical protein
VTAGARMAQHVRRPSARSGFALSALSALSSTIDHRRTTWQGIGNRVHQLYSRTIRSSSPANSPETARVHTVLSTRVRVRKSTRMMTPIYAQKTKSHDHTWKMAMIGQSLWISLGLRTVPQSSVLRHMLRHDSSAHRSHVARRVEDHRHRIFAWFLTRGGSWLRRVIANTSN